MRKKITALTVVFSLIIAMFAGGLQTFAAGADDISITGLVSDSATAQKFRIDNQTNRQIEVQWQTEEYNTGWTPVTIAANGSAVVNCADPDMTGVKLMVYCDGEIKSLASLNTYSVNVVYQDQSGNRLGGATEYNTISGGVSHTAPSSLQLSGETYLISGPEYKEFPINPIPLRLSILISTSRSSRSPVRFFMWISTAIRSEAQAFRYSPILRAASPRPRAIPPTAAVTL